MTSRAAAPSGPGDSPWPWLACVGILVAAPALAYSNSLSVPFVFDDIPSILANPTIHRIGDAWWPTAGTTVGGRPILNVSLAVNYLISGNAVWSYHALNVLIHVCSGLALFGIVRRTLGAGKDRGELLTAFAVALLWVLHPLDTESVTYVVQRAESLMGLFYLLTLYCFIRGAGTGRRLPWEALSVGACLLGMATKEVMVSAPLVVLAYDRTFLAGTFREALRKRRGVYLGLAATWLIMPFLVAAAHGRGGTAGFGSGVSWQGYALTQLGAVTHYLRLALFPQPLVFDYGTGVATATAGLLGYGLFIATLLGLTIWAWVARPALGFLGVFFFAVLAPSSSFIPVATQTMAEHRMYLPLAAIVVLAVLAIRALFGRWSLPLVVGIAAVLASGTWTRNLTYRTDQGLWADTLQKCPGNERAHLNLALDLQKDPKTRDEAVAHYRQALALRPDYPEADNDLAVLLESMPGCAAESADLLQKAIRLNPGYADAHYNLGNVLSDQGRNQEAAAEYREAIRQRPRFPEAQSNLAGTLSALGQSAAAIAEYGEALKALPDNAAIHYDLALELLRDPARRAEAIAEVNEVLRIQPDNAAARDLLNRIQRSQ